MPHVDRNPDRLYDLVPVVYRMRDADQGFPLQALLRVIAEQVILLEKDIAGLYENWFIETCQDWVVPYLGSLIDYRTVHDAGEPTAGGSSETSARNRILFPRADVANTVRFRRRKGTLAGIEQLAAAVSGWPVRAVEDYRLLSFTQNINYPHLNRGRTIDLRDRDALEDIGRAFDESAHGIDIRNGRGNLGEIRISVWRLKSYPVTSTPAYCYEQVGTNCFLFSALGNDTQLFTRPVPAGGRSPGKLNLPIPISLGGFEHFELDERGGARSGVPQFYGRGKSISIATGTPNNFVPPDQIVPADLSDWGYRPVAGQVAVDPHLGRIVFPPLQTRRLGVWVSYSYGFPADIGGGEYARTQSQPQGAAVYFVGSKTGQFGTIEAALAAWKTQSPANAVIEIVESGVYSESLEISLPANTTLKLRASSGTRPIIRLVNLSVTASDDLMISGAEGSWFSLEGLLVTGRGVQIDGDLAGVVIQDSTLVPGWALQCNCDPARPSEPSITIGGTVGCLRIEQSIVGAIQVNRDEVETDTLLIKISDSIVDATSFTRIAIGAPERLCAHASLTIVRSTIIGQIQTHAITLAENSILQGSVRACRRQQGCIRFCYVSPGSKTPRRYECQPDLVERAVRDLFTKGDLTPQEREILISSEQIRVEPDFSSTRYGEPTYCQLASSCAPEISAGADDESEMGVYHDLFQPQRIANLSARLAEYTPAGTSTGLVFAT